MASELQKKNDTDLKKELALKREALRNLRFGLAGSRGRNVREGRAARRDVARYMTEINSRGKVQGTAEAK